MSDTAIPANQRIDPEVKEALDAFHGMVGSGGLSAIADLSARRARFDGLVEEARQVVPASDRLAREDHEFERDGAKLPIRTYRPVDSPADSLPGIFYIHGGGMNIGSIEAEEPLAEGLTEAMGCVTASVGYRLAPENPHPVPVEDCYAGLVWVAENAEQLGIDPQRIAIFGASAGGGLAAGVALIARDRGGPEIIFQALIYPMLDDRLETPSSHEIVGIGLWDRPANAEGWGHLLGDRAGTADVSQYAAPARAESLSGLPPTYLECGELDQFRDEDIEYAARLMQAGVPTELFVYPGAVHATDFVAPQTALSQRVLERRFGAVRRALFDS